jgi:hypothetical protein
VRLLATSASRSVFGRSRLDHARRAIRIFRRASVASMREIRCRFLTSPHSSFVFAAQHESGRASSIARSQSGFATTRPTVLLGHAPDQRMRPQQVRDGPLVRGDQRRGRTAAAAKAICDEVEDDVGVVHPASRRSVAWSEHKDARLGAALAYYSVFSLGPRSSSRRSRCLAARRGARRGWHVPARCLHGRVIRAVFASTSAMR